MSKSSSGKEKVAERLKLARELAGLTQAQVAKMLKMHRPTISEIEAGRRNVSAQELSKFAEIYGVEVSWLSQGKPDDDDIREERVKLAARELNKLKPDDLERVMQLLKALRSEER